MIDIRIGDAITELGKLQSESVNCCVTSPPYFQLRDYKTSGQYGDEATVDEYIQQMRKVFQEVRRVLKPTGTLWLVLGDSYSNDSKWGGKTAGKHRKALHGNSPVCRIKRNTGFACKNLLMIPARVALALQEDGWFLRSDIIWHKPNAMPEPVRDRPTSAHEHIFLLTKSKKYFFDSDAIAEPVSNATIKDLERRKIPGNCKGDSVFGNAAGLGCGPRVRAFNTWPGIGSKHGQERQRGEKYERMIAKPMRNARNVWTIPTRPFEGAHFATFPHELARRCILAGCPPSGVVLDPFAGSGTTGEAAINEGRSCILIELNPAYRSLIIGRLERANLSLEALMAPQERSPASRIDCE